MPLFPGHATPHVLPQLDPVRLPSTARAVGIRIEDTIAVTADGPVR